jgi:transcriptional regulator with XRE-family HTH domain
MNELRLWRARLGLTALRAAKVFGFGEYTYRMLESGRLRPSIAQLKALGAYFGVDAKGLFKEVNGRFKRSAITADRHATTRR